MYLFTSWWIPQVPGLYFLLTLLPSLHFHSFSNTRAHSVLAHTGLQLTVIPCFSLLKFELWMWASILVSRWKNSWVPPQHNACHRTDFINMSSLRAARWESYFLILSPPKQKSKKQTCLQSGPSFLSSFPTMGWIHPFHLTCHLPSIQGLAPPWRCLLTGTLHMLLLLKEMSPFHCWAKCHFPILSFHAKASAKLTVPCDLLTKAQSKTFTPPYPTFFLLFDSTYFLSSLPEGNSQGQE